MNRQHRIRNAALRVHPSHYNPTLADGPGRAVTIKHGLNDEYLLQGSRYLVKFPSTNLAPTQKPVQNSHK